MANEPNTDLPLSPPGPLQADLIANPIIRRLGAVGGNTSGVIDKDLSTPPGSPVEGDKYIVGPSATGLWAGKENQIAYWQSPIWVFYPPDEGWKVTVLDESADYRFDGSDWITGGGTGTIVNTVNGRDGDVTVPVPIVVACSDEATAITSGAGKVTFRAPYAMTLTAVRANLRVAQTSGSTFTVDINKNGSSILSTKITIDNSEKTSVTAVIAPVLSSTTIDDDDEITVDVDQVGDGTAKGLKVALIGYQTPP